MASASAATHAEDAVLRAWPKLCHGASRASHAEAQEGEEEYEGEDEDGRSRPVQEDEEDEASAAVGEECP